MAMKSEFFLKMPGFRCDQTFDCGQAFRWRQQGGVWHCVASGKILLVREVSGGAEVTVFHDSSESRETIELFLNNYFDMGTDYESLMAELASKDRYMAEAVKYGSGIRLLRQDPFETLISFIISANNNIPRIKKIIENLCRKYGAEISLAGNISGPDFPEGSFYAFPEPGALASISEAELSDVTHAGYRCAYIINSASQFISRHGDISVPEQYMGVGPKVASCISLFTGTDMKSFPVDVWVRRVIGELYLGENNSKKAVAEFGEKYFGNLAGYAQQYLFYWRRNEE